MSGKITIIKILGSGDKITIQDIERWREVFRSEKMTVEEAVATGEVEIQVLPELDESNNYITVVKVGGDEYSPTIEDLENWREVFEEAKNDPDFKIFTHPAIEVDVINIGKIIAVE